MEYESFVTANNDLAALLQGSVKCKKGKPPSTKETRREAFDNYMKIIYRLPPNIKIDMDDIVQADRWSFYPGLYDKFSRNLPALKAEVCSESKLKIPVDVEKNEKTEKKAPVRNYKLKTLMKVKPWPAAMMEQPVIMEKDEEAPEIISPREKTNTPPPCHPTTPMSLPQPEPSPAAPTCLQQFADAAWIKEFGPNEKRILCSSSSDAFILQLLASLNTSSAPTMIEILTAMQVLHGQGLLQNTDTLYQGLIDRVSHFVRPDMSPVEQSALVQMLNLSMCLKPASYDFLKNLLALLALKQLGLRETVLHMLTSLQVNEAEQWLWPELEKWDSELQDPCDTWKSLRDRAASWLELWATEYKVCDRYRRSTKKRNTPTFRAADVLNYFCSVQKDEHRKARRVTPAARKDSVLLPLNDCSSQPIFHLGETYSMARTSRPSLILPPLRHRPFLTHFPKFISMPLPRLNLCPFHAYSGEDWVKVSSRRYFIPRQSHVDYYK